MKTKTKKNRSSTPRRRLSRSSTCKNKLNTSFIQKLRNSYSRSFCGKKSKCIKEFNKGFTRGFMKTCMNRKNN